jgi:3-isopropylmalate/(R)-2-methylmalate dehydratase small subunit
MTTQRVWRVGAEVDTDQLAPGEFMHLPPEAIAPHCLQSLRPDFAAGVQRGDVLVAGPGFGIGSSREQAAAVLVHMGLKAVIAPSFGGLFFRNAFNLGLLLLTCSQAEVLEEGETIGIDTDDGARILRGDGSALACAPLPDFLLQMVRSGGLFELLKRRYPKEPAHG